MFQVVQPGSFTSLCHIRGFQFTAVVFFLNIIKTTKVIIKVNIMLRQIPTEVSVYDYQFLGRIFNKL